MRSRRRIAQQKQAKTYRHPEAESPLRPDVGTQAQFKKKKPPKTYRYDSSLSPAMDWDGQNPARGQGEQAISETLAGLDAATSEVKALDPHAPVGKDRHAAIESALDRARRATERLKSISKPFLNWAGKAERLSLDVSTGTGRVVLLQLSENGIALARSLGHTARRSLRWGGSIHEFWRKRAEETFRAEGYEVDREFPIGNGKTVDLVIPRAATASPSRLRRENQMP